MSPLYPLLSQRTASLNCHMPLSNPFSTKGQHHSIVICPPPPPSLSKISTTQLSYVTTLPPSRSKINITQLSNAPSTPFSTKGQHHSNVICVPSTSFSLKGQRHSTVIRPLYPRLIQKSLPLNCHMPPSTPSHSKVSTNQLSYVPTYTHFFLKCQHHSTVMCPLYPLLN